ncbi:hypothetical protein BCT07_09675 [Vibrio breoganii]|uniref:glycosyltransferase family 4 protein n=1 Tax=Vibrio breoganii TaxID=553239 RepID=UPI000C844875|nr:glycosyltransferase family 4 protein [Vibrio breoganii]PMO59270.1 hypothetical protein BCT07_09675 [Vibrio breoganii]
MRQFSSKIIVCQHGARRRYAVPRMFEKQGILEAFYTDSYAQSMLGVIASKLGTIAPSTLQRLTRRCITGIPKNKIHATDYMFFIEFLQACLGRKKVGIQLFLQRHQILSKQMKNWGLRESSIVYSMYHENLDFIKWAKSEGAISVVDVFISPITDAVMEEEIHKFPDWNTISNASEVKINSQLWNETAELADLLICPSEWVAEGIRQMTPEATDKIRIVPYGCSIDYQGRTNKPIKGRVLFAGGDALRKGLHYLAEAASVLKKHLPELDVRIAGVLPTLVTEHPICKNLNFLGKLTSSQMKEEYLTADVFVLPSLSEGFAGVVAESIGAGCPVIVTKEAGSPIVDEREGLIIPSKSSSALVGAIDRFVTDRKFRDKCSKACINQVSFYSEDEWGERLARQIVEN